MNSIKKKKILIFIIGIFCFISMLCLGCENKKKDDMVQIGFTFDTLVLDRWTRDRDEFVNEITKLGGKVDIENANGDVEKQKEQIKNFIKKSIKVIVIIPVDCYKLTNEIKEARKKGIKVICYDRLINNVDIDLFVTINSERVGKEMIDFLNKKLPNGGEAAVILGPTYDTNTELIKRGIEKNKNSNINIVEYIYPDSWKPENGYKLTEAIIKKYPNIKGIICGNDSIARNSIKALSQNMLLRKVLVCGQDADLEACQRIVDGTQGMTVFKPINKLAHITAKCAYYFAKNKALPGYIENELVTERISDKYLVPSIKLEPKAITIKNIDEDIIKKGFYTKSEIYINDK